MYDLIIAVEITYFINVFKSEVKVRGEARHGTWYLNETCFL